MPSAEAVKAGPAGATLHETGPDLTDSQVGCANWIPDQARDDEVLCVIPAKAGIHSARIEATAFGRSGPYKESYQERKVPIEKGWKTWKRS